MNLSYCQRVLAICRFVSSSCGLESLSRRRVTWMTAEPAARDDGLAEYGGVEVGCAGLVGPETQTAGGVLVLAVRAGEPGAGLCVIPGPAPAPSRPGTRHQAPAGALGAGPGRPGDDPAASSSRSRYVPGIAWLAARSLREQSTSHREAS